MLLYALGKGAHMGRPQQPQGKQEPLQLKQPPHHLLKEARLKRGLSLQQTADRCGINIRQYQKFESGERDIRGCAFSLGLLICKTLDLDPWQFS